MPVRVTFAMQRRLEHNSSSTEPLNGANMALIKLHKTNEAGLDVGVLIINTDQLVAINAGPNATELQMADGRSRWVRDTPDEVASLAKAAG
jgi:hypothetical protein